MVYEGKAHPIPDKKSTQKENKESISPAETLEITLKSYNAGFCKYDHDFSYSESFALKLSGTFADSSFALDVYVCNNCRKETYRPMSLEHANQVSTDLDDEFDLYVYH